MSIWLSNLYCVNELVSHCRLLYMNASSRILKPVALDKFLQIGVVSFILLHQLSPLKPRLNYYRLNYFSVVLLCFAVWIDFFPQFYHFFSLSTKPYFLIWCFYRTF